MTNTQLYRIRLLSSLVAMMALMGVEAQAAQGAPRLVVSILVDQLRTDYLEAYAPLYGEGGLKRLLDQGRVYTDAPMPFHGPDRASAAACFSTGAVPFDNGVPSLSWLSRQTLQPVFCVEDSRYSGWQTTEKTSAGYLLTTTLADELEVSSDGLTWTYAIAPEREMAVLMAGHIADGAFWLNDQTGSWCGTSYYGQYPSWASVYERMAPLGERLKSLKWAPAVTGAEFKHTFEGDGRFRAFKRSGLINDEVVSFVQRCLEGSMLGRDLVPDLLQVGLYAGPHTSWQEGFTPEMQDTYVRLDRALAHLIESVEHTVGTGNALFVVASTGYQEPAVSPAVAQKYRIATGTFSMQRASMLLNMYLSAIFGQAQYVEGTCDTHIYLDHKLLEQRQLRSDEVLARCEEFIGQMEGVRDVYTATRLVQGAWNPQMARIRAGWNARRLGDLFVEVNPGWKIVTENQQEYIHQGAAYVSYPLFFLGNGRAS